MPPKGKHPGKCFYKAQFVASSGPCSVTASQALATRTGCSGSGNILSSLWVARTRGAEVNQEKVLFLGVPFIKASSRLSLMGET